MMTRKRRHSLDANWPPSSPSASSISSSMPTDLPLQAFWHRFSAILASTTLWAGCCQQDSSFPTQFALQFLATWAIDTVASKWHNVSRHSNYINPSSAQTVTGRIDVYMERDHFNRIVYARLRILPGHESFGRSWGGHGLHRMSLNHFRNYLKLFIKKLNFN